MVFTFFLHKGLNLALPPTSGIQYERDMDCDQGIDHSSKQDTLDPFLSHKAHSNTGPSRLQQSNPSG